MCVPQQRSQVSYCLWMIYMNPPVVSKKQKQNSSTFSRSKAFEINIFFVFVERCLWESINSFGDTTSKYVEGRDSDI